MAEYIAEFDLNFINLQFIEFNLQAFVLTYPLEVSKNTRVHSLLFVWCHRRRR